MQALLESFIQEINKIDDVGELRRRLIAMKKDEIESRNRESEYLRVQTETALLCQQFRDEAKGLRHENEEMRKKLEKLESKDKLDTNRLFGRKTEKIDDLRKILTAMTIPAAMAQVAVTVRIILRKRMNCQTEGR